MSHRCMLCIVYEPPNVELAMALAEFGRTAGDYHTIIWSPYWLPDTPVYKIRAASHGSIYVHEYNADGSLAGLHGVLSGWLSAAPARLRTAVPVEASSEALAALAAIDQLDPELAVAARRVADALDRRTVIAEDWLVRLGVAAVVLPEDNVERESGCWSEAAHRRGIPSTVVTSGVIDPRGAEAVYKNSSAHAVPSQLLPLVDKYLPQWLRRGTGYAITRLPLASALGQELAGVALRRPWQLNSGRHPRLVVESTAMATEYISHGYDPVKLLAAGHPSLDTLAAKLANKNAARATLAGTYGFDQAAPLCLLAIPPNRHATRAAPEYSTYRELVEAIVSITRERWPGTVLVSPHPAMTESERSWVSAAGGLVTQEPVAELLPLADLYVCAVSSTIKWALACAIPVLCYEAYRYDTDMSALARVALVRDAASYGAALSKLSESEELGRATLNANVVAADWGSLDGRSLERIASVCFGDAG